MWPWTASPNPLRHAGRVSFHVSAALRRFQPDPIRRLGGWRPIWRGVGEAYSPVKLGVRLSRKA